MSVSSAPPQKFKKKIPPSPHPPVSPHLKLKKKTPPHENSKT